MTMGMEHDAPDQPPPANNKRPREAAFFPAQEEEDDQVYEPPARKRSRTWSTTSSPPTVVVMPPADYPPQPSSSLLGRWSSLRQLALEEATNPSSGYSDDGEDSLESSSPSNNGAMRSFWQIMTATNATNSDDDNKEYDYDCHHHYNSNDYASTNAPYADPPLFFPIHNSRLPRPIRWGRLWTCLLVSALAVWCNKVVTPRLVATATPVDHILVPAAGRPTADLTLRDFLTHKDGYSLGMAPAFFGFYGYFGSLAAWEQAVAADILKPPRLRSVAGASAGAMAAILVAAGVSPLHAALDFCAALRLSDFADPPGVLAVFRGKRFEQIMEEYLDKESMCESLLLEDANLPVAVSAFDLQTMSGQILCEGSMARAARASATFPLLFQPVGWTAPEDDHGQTRDYTLIDGGITDASGVAGLMNRNPGRVINLKVGPFWGPPPAPSNIPGSTEVLSISLQNLPQPSPLAMELGTTAIEAASKAMKASLDVPLYKGKEENHYELHIDASTFWS